MSVMWIGGSESDVCSHEHRHDIIVCFDFFFVRSFVRQSHLQKNKLNLFLV